MFSPTVALALLAGLLPRCGKGSSLRFLDATTIRLLVAFLPARIVTRTQHFVEVKQDGVLWFRAHRVANSEEGHITKEGYARASLLVENDKGRWFEVFRLWGSDALLRVADSNNPRVVEVFDMTKREMVKPTAKQARGVSASVRNAGRQLRSRSAAVISFCLENGLFV